VEKLRCSSGNFCCRGRRVACKNIYDPVADTAALNPGQRVQIDIATGKNDSHVFSADVDLALHDRGIRNCC